MLTSSMVGSTWSGIIEMSNALTGHTLAHGQMVTMDQQLRGDCKVMVYDWSIASADPFHLTPLGSSHLVYIPADEEATFSVMKEICAGVGGIGYGARQVGISVVAAMDINPFVVSTLQANGISNPILGDIELLDDRKKLHEIPSSVRGWLACGFPCQPLSQQGDQRGHQDARAQPFFCMLKAAWEQQVAGVLLECVPAALKADYIQQGLQRLAWSLGMEIVQQVINLHHAWPCRRTRWWALLVPRGYAPTSVPDLPPCPEMQQVLALFPQWPCWSVREEGLLMLTQEELELYNNPMYGNDHRHLRLNAACPCILHSYGVVLQPCPCGCRDRAFNPIRLQNGGIRGFYVTSMVTGQVRFLHPKEAAVLCGLPPTLHLPGEGRTGLCLIGQCASPIQSMWVLAHFIKHTFKETINPMLYVTTYTMNMLREIHGGFTFRKNPAPMECQVNGSPMYLSIAPATTVRELKLAETKIRDWGTQVQLADEVGRLPDHHLLQTESLLGTYTMIAQSKRQATQCPTKPVNIIISGPQGTASMHVPAVPAGTFFFEVLDNLGLPRNAWVQTSTEERIYLDQRLWTDMELAPAPLQAGGHVPQGLTDGCIDWMANRLLEDASNPMPWITCRTSTLLFDDPDQSHQLPAWSFASFDQGFLSAAIDGHWILLHFHRLHDSLIVDSWNGLDEDHGSRILPALTKLAQMASLRPVILQHHCTFPQLGAFCCGTVALQHLGALLQLWDADSAPDQLIWHEVLRWFNGHPNIIAYGSGGKGKGHDTDRDTIWALRDILHNHGVPEDRTEERATMAINKIGLGRLQEALSAKNVWATLKALGSQPGVNFLWIKADGLEAQIKRKAQSKFKIQSSSKKNAGPKNSELKHRTWIRLCSP